MPITVWASPFREIARPTICGSLAKREVHSLCVITVTRGPPGASSCAVKVRPTSVAAPKTRK